MKRALRIYLILSILIAASQNVLAQGCNNPVTVCQSTGPTSANSSEGSIALLPADLCFDSGNTLFYSFSTLNSDYLTANNINFIGNAQINIGAITCDTAQTGTPSISAAVVAAGNPCNPNTYSPALDCVPLSTTGNFSMALNNLQPGTEYYIIFNVETLEDGTASTCDFTIEITGPAVTYNLNATADPLTIIAGETVSLGSNEGFEDYVWTGDNLNNPETQNTSATLETEGEYTYTVTANVDGCPVTSQVLVTVVPALIIYNTITPNGDGFNDSWNIVGIERFPDAEVKVHSRWGQIVYRKRGYTNNPGWDGGELPEAVYYYIIELNPLGFETRPYTGSLTIVR